MAPEGGLDKTILYLTDHSLDPWLADRCRELLVKSSCGLPIVSVSQKPIDFGDNICVGEIGRSGLSMDKQTLAGLLRIQTKWVAFAEHDCIYSPEHFFWVPSDEENFWYNDNVWLVQYRNPLHPDWDGMFSYVKGRRVQSQLVCATDLLLEATKEKIGILGSPAWVNRNGARAIGEPGAADYTRTMRLAKYKSMRPVRISLKRYITEHSARDFATIIPNIDIRHGDNFTGQRRGKKRRFELEPWGRLECVLGGPVNPDASTKRDVPSEDHREHPTQHPG